MAPLVFNDADEPWDCARHPIQDLDDDNGSGRWSALPLLDGGTGSKRLPAVVNDQMTMATQGTTSYTSRAACFDAGSVVHLPDLESDSWEDESLMSWVPTPSLRSTCSSVTSQTESRDIMMAGMLQQTLDANGQVVSEPQILDQDMLSGSALEEWFRAPLLAFVKDEPLTLPFSETKESSQYAGKASSRLYMSDSDNMSDASVAMKQHVCTCGLSCSTNTELERHAKAEEHKPFICGTGQCVTSFARRDALLRHRATHTVPEGPLYECSECERYRGVEAFKRRDHLVQHVRKVHPDRVDQILSPKYCTVSSCRLSAKDGQFGGFANRKDQARHMRDAHGLGTRDCEVPGCDRTGAKGFARDRDLRMHVEKVHQLVV